MRRVSWQCGDGYCLIGGRRTGQHTNGGCRCLLDLKPIEKRRAVHAALSELAALRDRMGAAHRLMNEAAGYLSGPNNGPRGNELSARMTQFVRNEPRATARLDPPGGEA